MEAFILELGVSFAFLERQKGITLDGEDHYLDLLFYHRHLRRLVAIDLKLREFKPGDKGQMELYLRWLGRHERKPGEEGPIGLILCTGQRHETMELLDLEKSGIRVSSYWTEVLPKKKLQKKLHEAAIFCGPQARRASVCDSAAALRSGYIRYALLCALRSTFPLADRRPKLVPGKSKKPRNGLNQALTVVFAQPICSAVL